ncbi:MAG: hypothetical protein KA746_09520 [Pyrinomonadaceae bacterium]|nr:hypothetical protein [Pyrinomonadaceae bacterium]
MIKYLVSISFIVVSALTTLAADPAVWSVNSRPDVLKGDARGVSIDDNGMISLAPRLTEVYKTEQSFVWASAVDNAGNVYLATGGEGKVFKVDASGKGAVFADLDELNVSAVVVGRSGEIFASTSPDGKVYRLDASGKATVYFEPKEKYIWSMAVMSDGSLAVATGDSGKIYRVKAANASAESSLLFDTSETHIISLAADAQGNLYAGSDSNGLVFRFGPDGKPFGLLDSPLREIHDLAIGPDGSVYALALGESVAAKPAEATPAAATEIKPVTVERANPLNPETPAKSRYDLSAAKSAVYRISLDGGSDILWSSGTVVGFSIHAHQTGNGVLLGTSDKGRIFNISNEGRETLALQTGASQISTLAADGRGLFATSSNQGNLFRIGPDVTAEGTYESAVLDAKATATWGRIWWRSTGAVTIQTRSGNTEKADESWSSWSAAASDPRGTQIVSPKARYFQWRATLKASATTATLSEVNTSFAARNIAPEVLSVQILPTNVGLAANPPVQVDPNIELSGMDPITFGVPNAAVPPRRVFQRAATSLQWTAEDRNGDKLVFDVYYREIGDTAFKPLRADLTDNFIAVDGQSLADGRYIFKVVARDTPSNPVALVLKGERISEPVDIDNTAPTITAAGAPTLLGDKARVIFDAVDSSSYITRAEYSVNGGPWVAVYADDGISDGPKERYTVEIPVTASGEYVVTLRVFDVNANAGNARAVIKK